MAINLFYLIGSILLLLGLSWMLLPHAFHSQILREYEPEEQAEHYLHLLQGLIAAVSGLGMMLLSDKQEKNKLEKNKTMRKAF